MSRILRDKSGENKIKLPLLGFSNLFTYCVKDLSVLVFTIQSKFNNKHRKILRQQIKERVYKHFRVSIHFIPMFYFRDTGLGQYQIFFYT